MTQLQPRFTTEGLVIKEMNVGESDRLVTLFTRDYGIIKAFASGAKSVKSKRAAATALLTYSSFTITSKKDTYRITEASPITMFFAFGTDVETLSLSQYFCELCYEFAEQGTPNNELLRLVLNSLYFITKDKKYPPLIKAVTEFRIATISGYLPDLVACSKCGKFEDSIMYFNVRQGFLCCKDCAIEKSDCIVLDRTLLSALRHIAFSEFGKLYSFSIPEKSADKLSQLTEKYLTTQIDHRFLTLDFYNGYSLSKQ